MLPFLHLFLILLLGVLLPYTQADNGVTSPQAGDAISGVVVVEGTAVHPDYLRYELAFLYLDSPNPEWIVFAERSEPVVNGTLAIWDTEVGRNVNAPVFPDGRYELRLRVVKTDYNYDEFFLTEITISNDGPTPTPTVDPTAVSLTATALSIAPAPSSSDESSFLPATPLPSLTPFPTPTPQATPVGNVPQVTAVPVENQGLLDQLGQARWGNVGSAFVLGITLTGGLFGLGILYLLFRAIGRRLWRLAWHRINSQE
ncbi:MAG: hypothetical protein AAF490_33165 [Chloroflexota bacterium]